MYLAAIVDDPMRRWKALAWQMRMFREFSSTWTDERLLLARSAVHICVLAWSLRLWTLERVSELAGGAVDEAAFDGRVRASIPEQRFCEAVARQARTAYQRDGAWPDDLLQMFWAQPSEEGPGGWMMRYEAPGYEPDLPVFAFLRLDRDWRRFLEVEGLAEPEPPRRSWRRIFGRK